MSGWSAEDVDLPSGVSELSNALRSATSPPEADVSLFQIAGPSRPRSTSPSPESHPSGDHGVPAAHALTLERLLGAPRPRTQSPPTDRPGNPASASTSSRDAARMRAQRSQLGMSWPNEAIDSRRRGRERERGTDTDDFPWRNAVETARRAGYTVNERIRREREGERGGDQAQDREGDTATEVADTDARAGPSTARRQETSATARVIRDLVRQPRGSGPIAIPGRSSVISLGPEQVVPTSNGYSWASYHAGSGRSQGTSSRGAAGASGERNLRMATSLLRRRREDEAEAATGSDTTRRAGTEGVETTRTLDDNTTSRTRIAYSYDPTDIEPPGGADDHIWDMLGTLDSSDDEDHDGVGRERWGTYRTGMPIGDLPGPQALLFDYFDVDGWGSPPDGGAALSRGRYNRRRQSMRGRAVGGSDAEGEREAPFAIDFGTSNTRTRMPVPIDRASSRHLVRRGRGTYNDSDSDDNEAYPATPLKRRKCDEPQPDTARPSYLDLSTLPADAELPTHFQSPIRSSNIERTSHFVVTVAERRGVARPIVTYQPRARDRDNLTREDSDACSLHTSRPIPVGVGVYYFEVEVVGSGDEDYISVGWTRAGVNHRRLVGWNHGSWGWHADDGKIFEGHGEGRDFSQPWGTGDTVGCGIDYTTGRAFFTQNGKLLGHAFTAMPHDLYPAVGMRNPHESVAVNLTGPFVYDIDEHVRGVRNKVRGALEPAHEAFSDLPKPGAVPRLVGVPSKKDGGDSGETDAATAADAAAAVKDWPTLSEPEALLLMKIKAKVAAVKSEVATAKTTEESPAAQLPDGSRLRDPPRRAAAAFVLDHLDVAGLAGVRALVLRDMRARGLLPESSAAEADPEAEGTSAPAAEPQTKSDYASPAAAVLAAVDALRGGTVRWALIKSFGADLGPLENRLHIYEFAADARASAASAAGESGGMDVDVDVDVDADEDDADERAVASGRELRRRARSERWARHDVALLDRAAHQLVAPDDSLDAARNADADRLDTLLRDAAGIKRHSCLHRAVAQTGLVHDVLRENNDELASFMGMRAVLD